LCINRTGKITLKRHYQRLEACGNWDKAMLESGSKTFDYWWDKAGDLVEEGNSRYGGNSSVVRAKLAVKNSGICMVYIKRQVNQLRRNSNSWFSAKSTYWVEHTIIKKLAEKELQVPEVICYGGRTLPGELPVNRRSEIIRLVGQTLAVLHALNFVHRTLYTQHIFIAKDFSKCRLIDFERGRFRRNSKVAMNSDLERLFRRAPELQKEDRRLIIDQYNQQI